jgi:hypothetical protein
MNAPAIIDLCGEALCTNEATHEMVALLVPEYPPCKLCPSCLKKAEETIAQAGLDDQVDFRSLAEIAANVARGYPRAWSRKNEERQQLLERWRTTIVSAGGWEVLCLTDGETAGMQRAIAPDGLQGPHTRAVDAVYRRAHQ